MAAAEHYAHSRSGTITFAVVDEAGRLHGYHARDVAPSASVLKAMLLVAYLRRADVRGRNLEQWELDLLAPMIRRSNNAAATRMVGLVGKARLDAIAKVAGMEHFRLHWPIWGQSEITPRGQALFFHRIDHLVPARHRRYALRLLATVVPSQRWGVGRVPHELWNLYFKGGWGSGTGLVDHQVALYRAGDERFSLALFTRFDPDHAYGKETLRGPTTRLLRGVPAPGRRLARARRVALSRAAVVTSRPGCAALTIRPNEGGKRTFATGAASCSGFELASAGSRAL
jgi:Beta-lactamase enzyme family